MSTQDLLERVRREAEAMTPEEIARLYEEARRPRFVWGRFVRGLYKGVAVMLDVPRRRDVGYVPPVDIRGVRYHSALPYSDRPFPDGEFRFAMKFSQMQGRGARVDVMQESLEILGPREALEVEDAGILDLRTGDTVHVEEVQL